MTTAATLHTGIWTIQIARARFRARGIFGHVVDGTIDVRSGTIEVDAEHQPRQLRVTLDPASIDTGSPRRDKDLRGKRFLGVATHPAMILESDQFSLAPRGWQCRAILHVAGAAAPLLIDAELDDSPTDSFVRVHGSARLDLRDAGITVPALLVRRYVDLEVSAELVHTW